MPLTDVKKL